MANRTSLFSAESLVTTKPKKCWSWSIHPLVIWIRILGVDIPGDVSTECSRSSSRVFAFIYGLLCFLIHIAGQSDVLYVIYLGLMNDESATASWNLNIEFINYAVFAISGHLILLVIIRPRWITMMERFQCLDFSFNYEYYVRIRKLSFYGVIFIILLVIGLNLFLIGDEFVMKINSSNVVLVNVVSTFYIIYPLTNLLLFAILSYASSSSFHFIQMEIMKYRGVHIANNLEYQSNKKDKDLLETFKCRHSLVCDTIDVINYSLGWTLLLSVPFSFMAIISCCFTVFAKENVMTVDSLLDIMFLVYSAAQLTLICFSADQIRTKAHGVVLELLRLNYEESIVGSQKDQIQWLAIEMAHSVPQISANGYFCVNKSLILKSIGTTITYFFILFQFESSEYE